MSKKDTARGSTIVDTIRSDSLKSIGKDYAEIGLDSALESGILRDIPVVNTVVGLFSFAGTIRDSLLTSKIIRFINQLSELSTKERIAMTDKLNDDDKFAGKAGSVIIEILDRMESAKKPEIAAKAFGAFAKDEISFEELRRILFALERLPSFDFDKLAPFSKATIQESVKMDESLLLTFVNAGLGKNNGGFDGGAILPTNLCKLLAKLNIFT
ncbi:hypothetical protein P5705_15975 [Pseudomonas entomophila]|uniref:hypothetical protein n=1 Tax=Pseudomonas entomophila TaxID=312306 RepID=UPI002405F671|nr:hypothetical protein [Pseudomonas entomophila]MDF9619146.1 hypothetical protein [Pseudomonas entomophila]